MSVKITNNQDNKLLRNLTNDNSEYKKFINLVAESLYDVAQRSGLINPSLALVSKEFKKLKKTQKSFWLDYAAELPYKFRTLNLIIRSFEDYCRTCIISDKEVAVLAQIDQDYFKSRKSPESTIQYPSHFFIELNYLVPLVLKKAGYEVIRIEEVSEIQTSIIIKLARAIHSRYLHEIRSQSIKSKNFLFFNPGNTLNQYDSDFDNLPDEIKYSNIDNAAHIPTKLLSIGYKIRQVKKGFKPFALHLNEQEIETMARVEHIRWSWEKRLNEWTFGGIKDDIKKTHPSLIPYDDLSDADKEKDRELVKLIPAFLQDIDFEAFPVSPNRIRKLSYAIKPQSVIHKILAETTEMNQKIRELVTLTPVVEEMVSARNQKIEEAIREIEGSYNYAQHIQETFLPDDLFIRECFPDSFVLFKPKDIVSGDFYFFSKLEHRIIFAAVDCTGHGIPGALLSTLGYGILDQAVNEIKLTEPSHILHHLYSRIHRYLRNDSEGTGIADDMDIILCIFDTKSNKLTYSGVKNSLYRITNGELVEYEAQNSPDVNCEEGECQFTSTTIQLDMSDVIYLCSDGYSDQFGGKHHKKYLTSRLKNFLLTINDCSMPEQSDRLYEEIETWKDENNEDQTDDILVIGIRI